MVGWAFAVVRGVESVRCEVGGVRWGGGKEDRRQTANTHQPMIQGHLLCLRTPLIQDKEVRRPNDHYLVLQYYNSSICAESTTGNECTKCMTRENAYFKMLVLYYCLQ